MHCEVNINEDATEIPYPVADLEFCKGGSMSRLALVLKQHPINYILICTNDDLRSYVHVRTRYPCHPCPASVIVEFTCKRDNRCVYSARCL